jgi:hypothetical protein
MITSIEIKELQPQADSFSELENVRLASII